MLVPVSAFCNYGMVVRVFAMEVFVAVCGRHRYIPLFIHDTISDNSFHGYYFVILYKCDHIYSHDRIDRFLVQDANYNVVALVDPNSGSPTVQERYVYAPYGERTVLDSNWANPTVTSEEDFHIGHQGLLHDGLVYVGEIIGIKRYSPRCLIYNRNRMLHPTLGLFIQRDPLGYVDGMSLYGYYAGMMGEHDPTGNALPVIIVGGVALTAAQAAALAAAVSLVVCATIPSCRTAAQNVAQSALNAISSQVKAAVRQITGTVKKITKIRCRLRLHHDTHYWRRISVNCWGMPKLVRCYFKHVQLNCYLQGVKGSGFVDERIPYGPCYMNPRGNPPGTHPII
jgi:RHS repeat-associated protein